MLKQLCLLTAKYPHSIAHLLSSWVLSDVSAMSKKSVERGFLIKYRCRHLNASKQEWMEKKQQILFMFLLARKLNCTCKLYKKKTVLAENELVVTGLKSVDKGVTLMTIINVTIFQFRLI